MWTKYVVCNHGGIIRPFNSYIVINKISLDSVLGSQNAGYKPN